MRGVQFCMLLLLGSAGIPAHAQNLIINSNFNTDLSGWNSGCGVPFFWQDTSMGSPSPPSAVLSGEQQPGFPFSGCARSNCITVTAPSQRYDLSLNTNIYDGQGVAATVELYSGAGCTGTVDTNTLYINIFNNSYVWKKWSMLNFGLPSGTASVDVNVGGRSVVLSNGYNDLYVYFDHVFFGPTDTIFADGFGS